MLLLFSGVGAASLEMAVASISGTGLQSVGAPAGVREGTASRHCQFFTWPWIWPNPGRMTKVVEDRLEGSAHLNCGGVSPFSKSRLRWLTALPQRRGGRKSKTAGRGFALEEREDFPWVKLFRKETMSKNKFSEILQ